MRKGDYVAEIGDEGRGAYIGRYAHRQGYMVAVRWSKKCLRWHRRSDLRMANEAEIARAKESNAK